MLLDSLTVRIDAGLMATVLDTFLAQKACQNGLFGATYHRFPNERNESWASLAQGL